MTTMTFLSPLAVPFTPDSRTWVSARRKPRLFGRRLLGEATEKRGSWWILDFFCLAWGMMTHSFFQAHLDKWNIRGSWWILVGGLIWDEAVSNDPRSCSLSLQRWNRGSWGVNAPASGNAIEIPPKSKQNTCPRNNVATNKSGRERERAGKGSRPVAGFCRSVQIDLHLGDVGIITTKLLGWNPKTFSIGQIIGMIIPTFTEL